MSIRNYTARTKAAELIHGYVRDFLARPGERIQCAWQMPGPKNTEIITMELWLIGTRMVIVHAMGPIDPDGNCGFNAFACLPSIHYADDLRIMEAMDIEADAARFERDREIKAGDFVTVQKRGPGHMALGIARCELLHFGRTAEGETVARLLAPAMGGQRELVVAPLDHLHKD